MRLTKGISNWLLLARTLATMGDTVGAHRAYCEATMAARLQRRQHVRYWAGQAMVADVVATMQDAHHAAIAARASWPGMDTSYSITARKQRRNAAQCQVIAMAIDCAPEMATIESHMGTRTS